MKTILITARCFTILTKKFIPDLDVKEFAKQFDLMEHGDFLVRIENKETGKTVVYRLRKIFFKEYTMKYSVHSKVKSGKEILISNFELPKGNPVNYKK